MKEFISSLQDLGERSNTFNDVCQTYKEFGTELRKLCGGSAGGFTGLLECLFFLAVKKKLEEELRVEMLNEKLENDRFERYIFKNEKVDLVMTRDIQIKRIQKDSASNKKPDIAIYKNRKLIAVFSLKASVTGAGTFLEGLKKDLTAYKTANSAVMFFLALQGIESFADSQKRANANRNSLLEVLKGHQNVHLLVYSAEDKYHSFFLNDFRSLVIDLPDAVKKVVARLQWN